MDKPDLSHKIAQQLWGRAKEIRTVEDMAAIIREKVGPLEQQYADLYDRVSDLPGGEDFLNV